MTQKVYQTVLPIALGEGASQANVGRAANELPLDPAANRRGKSPSNGL